MQQQAVVWVWKWAGAQQLSLAGMRKPAGRPGSGDPMALLSTSFSSQVNQQIVPPKTRHEVLTMVKSIPKPLLSALVPLFHLLPPVIYATLE